jgi:hypothetical protein
MALSRKMKRGKMSRRRGKKATRRVRQRGGGEYVLKFAGVPSAGGPAPEGLGDLGTYSAGNQTFTIATTKPIHDIKIFKADGVTELKMESFGTNVQTKISIKVGPKASLVPSTIKSSPPPATGGVAPPCPAGVPCIRGATQLSPAAPQTGNIVVKGLNASTLNLMSGQPQGFVVKVTTA